MTTWLNAPELSSLWADVAGVVAVAFLARSLRRPAGRQPRWHLAFVLLAAAMPCIAAAGGPRYAYGPGYGTATGIVARCSAAVVKAGGWAPNPSRVVIVSAENEAGKVVASQRLPLRTPGARYRMRLLAGTYSINISTEFSDGYEMYDDWEYVPASGRKKDSPLPGRSPKRISPHYQGNPA